MVQGYAAYAVWAFFVLSGFLMTLVLTTKYGFDRPGIRAYAFNRFMRIFPLYWIAALMGLATLWYYGRYGIDLRPINGEFYMPSGLREWSYAITLFPGIQRGGLPVAVSNALGIEVGFYMLMPFLARSKSTAWFAFILAIILNLKLGIVGESFGDRYATFLPCMLPFAAGALACLYREKLSKFNMPITSLIVWLVHGGLWLYLPGYPWTWGLYISMILSVWMVLSLIHI